MGKIVIDENAIQTYIRSMTNYLNEFNAIVEQIKKIPNDLVWESNKKTQFLASYNNIINEYITFSNNMAKFIDYLDDYARRFVLESASKSRY